jgi:hypothetical protein
MKYPRECPVFVHRSLGEIQLATPVNSKWGMFAIPRLRFRGEQHETPVSYKMVVARNAAARDLLAAVIGDA